MVAVSLLETFWSSSYIALTRSWASWKYLNSSLANGFGVFSSVYRFFRLLSMNYNKPAAELKASFTVVKQDSNFATSSLPLQPSTPEMNLLMFWHNPHFSFLIRSFSLSDGAFNLDDKGDRFGQHLDLGIGSTQRRCHFAGAGRGGNHETFHYR